MPLPTNRTAGSVIQSADINAIADAVNDAAPRESPVFTGSVGVGGPSLGASLFSNDSVHFGNLALSDRKRTRGLTTIHGQTILSTDLEDVHGALIVGNLQGLGAGATHSQVFGAEIQAETNNVAGITPGVMVGVNAIALHQSNTTIGAGQYIAGVNGIVQFGNPGTPALSAGAVNAVSVRADAVEFVTPGHTVTNAFGFYAKAQTVGSVNLSIFSEGDISTAGGSYVGSGFGVAKPLGALSVALNTVSTGITAIGKFGLVVQAQGATTQAFSTTYESNGFLVGGTGFINIGQGAGTGDWVLYTRGVGFSAPALQVANDGVLTVTTTVGARAVVVGAVDSAGAGFRALRVAN